MTDYDDAAMEAAFEEMDQLTAAFHEAERSLDAAREAVQEALVRHLKERNAPPGKLAEHSPYDRNHVGRIARANDVPHIREPKPKPRKRTAGGKASG